MTTPEDKMFPSPEEEVRALAKEFTDLKESVHMLTAKLALIERRIRTSFPSAMPKSAKVKKSDSSNDQIQDRSAKTRDQLLGTFDKLSGLWRSGQEQRAIDMLDALPGADVGALARELGIVSSNRASHSTAKNGIRRCLIESAMLSRNRNMIGSEKSPPASSDRIKSPA